MRESWKEVKDAVVVPVAIVAMVVLTLAGVAGAFALMHTLIH